MEVSNQSVIGQNIKVLRIAKGYSQSQMAYELHICRTSYCQIEAGHKVLTTDVLMNLSKIFNINANVIFEKDQETFYKKIYEYLGIDNNSNRSINYSLAYQGI